MNLSLAWLDIGSKSLGVLAEPLENADGGPLSSLITEMEFNHTISEIEGCPFEMRVFQHAISDGILSLLDERLRDHIMVEYGQIMFANHELQRLARLHPTEYAYRDEKHRVRKNLELLTRLSWRR